MTELTQLRELPKFPENSLGLLRGSMIRCISDEVEAQLGIPVGVAIPIGFDGTYVRCGGFTWDIAQLVHEISEWKVWEIADPIDLSDPTRAARFMREVELIEIVAAH